MNIIIIIIITVAITAIEWRSGDNDVTNDLVLHRILEHKLRASGCNLTMLGVVGQQCCVCLQEPEGNRAFPSSMRTDRHFSRA